MLDNSDNVNITAAENSFSGSRFYVSTKTPAEALVRLSNAWSHLIGIISPALQEKYQALSKEALTNQLVHSSEYAKAMVHLGRSSGADNHVNEKLNYRFFTHNSDASLNALEADEILGHFPPDSDSHHWPNLILTSSHALVRSHEDVSSIMKGIHALTRDIFGDKNDGKQRRLPLLERTSSSQNAEKSTKKSIILSSVYNNHNAWVNGGTLLHRLNYLDGLYENEAREEAKQIPDEELQKWREKHYLGEKDWAMSPAAIRLAKLILKLIVTEPEKVNVPDRRQFEKQWRDDLTLSYNCERLTLRPDAREVLQHIKLVGYSKGGNIVTDALRYLTLDLRHQQLISIENGNSSHAITKEDMRALLMNTGILAINPGISPLTQHEKECGIRRLSVRNPEDWITAHLFARHQLQDHKGKNDDIYEIHPAIAPKGLGHGPEEALGNMDKSLIGYLCDPQKVQSDPSIFEEMRSRLQCFLASCHGKSGIKSVREDGNVLYLEFSAGASRDDTQKVVSKLEAELRPSFAASNQILKIDFDWNKSCEIAIRYHPNECAANSPANLNRAPRLKERLGETLSKLEENGITFVGHNVYRDLGVKPPQKGKIHA